MDVIKDFKKVDKCLREPDKHTTRYTFKLFNGHIIHIPNMLDESRELSIERMNDRMYCRIDKCLVPLEHTVKANGFTVTCINDINGYYLLEVTFDRDTHMPKVLAEREGGYIDIELPKNSMINYYYKFISMVLINEHSVGVVMIDGKREILPTLKGASVIMVSGNRYVKFLKGLNSKFTIHIYGVK